MPCCQSARQVPFTPKLCILVGPKKASVLIGSHNLTLSGFGYNREVTNWVEVAGPKDAEGAALLADAWRMASQWIEMERGKGRRFPLRRLWLANFVNPLSPMPNRSLAQVALTHAPYGPPLIDQISERISPDVSRIGIVGAFFDKELAFVGELARRWPRRAWLSASILSPCKYSLRHDWDRPVR